MDSKYIADLLRQFEATTAQKPGHVVVHPHMYHDMLTTTLDPSSMTPHYNHLGADRNLAVFGVPIRIDPTLQPGEVFVRPNVDWIAATDLQAYRYSNDTVLPFARAGRLRQAGIEQRISPEAAFAGPKRVVIPDLSKPNPHAQLYSNCFTVKLVTCESMPQRSCSPSAGP